MSDWDFGMDCELWLYPPVSPDHNYEPPDPIEAANIDGTLMVNASDAIEQVRRLQTENDSLRDVIQVTYDVLVSGKVNQCELCDMLGTCENHPAPPPCKYDCIEETLVDWLREQGVEVDG